MIPEIAQRTNVPILLFANPEKPTPDKIWEQNSFCGANMAAHVMHKLGKKYQFIWGESKNAAELFEPIFKALECIKIIKNTRTGLIGGRVPGFYTSNFNEMRLRSMLGTAVEIIDLLEVVDKANKVTEDDAFAGLKKFVKVRRTFVP